MSQLACCVSMVVLQHLHPNTRRAPTNRAPVEGTMRDVPGARWSSAKLEKCRGWRSQRGDGARLMKQPWLSNYSSWPKHSFQATLPTIIGMQGHHRP